jgi:protease YdgD
MRTARAFLVALSLVWGGPVAAAPEALEPAFAWNAIGRVNVPHGFCTGTLVGPAEVLTAAHCLRHPRQGRIYAPDEVHFVAGWRRGAWVAHARATGFRLAPDLAFDRDGLPTRLEADWAVLRLERALLDLDLLQPLAVGWPARAGGRGDGAQLLGYAQDRPHLPVRMAPCPVEAPGARPGLVLHGCVASQGLSGAPLLVPAATGWSVVAVHLGSILHEGRRVGVAVPVRRLVPDGLLR